MSKKKQELLPLNKIDEIALLKNVSTIIESRKHKAIARFNYENVLMFWEVGQHIGSVLLGGERAGYGKQIVVTLSQQFQKSMEVVLNTRMLPA